MEMFETRSGTRNEGWEYEDKITAYLALLLSKTPEIIDFKISANDSNFGKFDDIVLEIIYPNSTKRFALQLKHSRKIIPANSFLAQKGDFSLETYKKDVQNLKLHEEYHFILFTNAGISDKLPNLLEVQADDLINTGGRAHQISSEDEFFKKFYIYSSQSNNEDIKNSIKRLFFMQNSYEQFLKFIEDWNKAEGRKFKLDKEIVSCKFAECLLSPFSVTSVGEVPHQEFFFEKIFSKFQVTSVDDGCPMLLCYDRDFVDKKRQKISWITEKQFGLTQEDLVKLLWHLKELPLIITHSEITEEAIKLCSNKRSFILIGRLSLDLEILQDFSDLTRPELEQDLKRFKFQLHGQEYILYDFVNGDEDLAKIFTTDILIKMLSTPLTIGAETTVIFPYIHRLIPKTILSEDVFKIDDIIVVSGRGKLLHPYDVKLEHYLNYQGNGKIIFTQGLCEEFSEVCSRHGNENVHHLAITSNGNLEWLTSKGSVKSLLEFQKEVDEESFEDKEALVNFTNPTNVLCADPGMGKSVIMEFFKQNSRNLFPILINLREFTTIENDIYDKQFDELTKKIVSVLLEKRKVIVLWDGIDELPQQLLAPVVEFIKRSPYKKWIAGRSHLRNLLEEEFSTCALSLKELNEDQQKSYIKTKLGEAAVDKILNHIKNLRGNILGIPLQLYMLTEIYEENLAEDLILTDIYGKFVDKKFEFIDAKMRSDNALAMIDKSFLKQYLMENYEKLAIWSCSSIDVGEIPIIEQIRRNGDNKGFIVKVTDVPVFVHNTYSEYFSACYLKRRFKLINRLELTVILFEERYRTVRYMFDMLMANGSCTHFAVLYQDPTLIGDCTKVDLAGRTALQIACAYSTEKYIPMQETEGTATVHKTVKKFASDAERQIINQLVQQCDFYQKDELLGLNTFQYCEIARTLLPLEILSSDRVRDLQIFQKRIYTFLYHCARMNYVNLFGIVRQVPFFEIVEVYNQTKKTCSLLHVVAEHSFENSILEKVLEEKRYLDNSRYEENPLHLSTKNGKLNYVKMLFENGIDINSRDYNDSVPLHYASTVEVVRFLIDEGADYNLFDGSGYKPLHLAAWDGYIDVVKYFLEEKKMDVDDCTKGHYSSLYLAAGWGHMKIVEYLLDNGADVNLPCQDKSTPVHAASRNGHCQVVEYLFQKGGKIDVFDEIKYTPLHYAARNGKLDVVEFLLSQNVDVNACCEIKQTALFLAARWDYKAVVECLIQNGAHVNARDKNGYAPIHMASRFGCIATVKCLLGYGADVHGCDEGGLTPLQLAINNGDNIVATLLLEVQE